MDRVIDSGIEMLNAVGQMFCSHAWSVFVQVSVLIAALLALDLLLRRHVRAVVRYAMWMLVFVKLLLPPTLSLPTGIGYYRPEHKTVSQKPTEPVAERPAPIALVRPVRREPVVVSPPVVDVPHADVVPAPAAPAAVRPAITWQGLVFLGWLAGVLILSVYLLRRVQYVRKLIRRSTPASETLADVLTQCAAVLRLRSCPALRLSDDAPGPAVCGLFRPVVLLPTSLAEGLHGERLRTVLVHELAHIRRADLWVNFAQTLLLVVYFYHPLLWLANAIVRRLREQAVDETVLVALDAEAESYGTTLIDLAEMTFHRPALGLRLIGIAESRKALEGRIRHMITQPRPRTAKLGLCGLLALALAAAVLLPMARAKTEAEKPLFVVRLPNGVTAELLGVCNWPNERIVCWRPDGSPLAPPLHATKSHVRPAADRYGFMLRVTGPGDLNVSWRKIEGADGWEGSCDVVTSDGTRLDDCTAAVANMKAGQQQTALRVGFATGPWSTISTHDGKGMSSGARTGVLWSQAFADSAGTYIVATAEWTRDRVERIIAIDTDGVTHTPPGGSVASGNMDQMTTRFPGLKPDQIKEFQYQVRPYEWAQFNNVSLRPGRTTSVTVEPIVAEGGTSRVGDEPARPDRDHSRAQLSALGRALLIYANDHDDKLPETLADVQDEVDQAGDLSLSWVRENVAYLGRGMTTSNEPDDPVAYDQTLYEQGTGTNVLHLDTSVAFESPERLEELGIGPDKPSPAVLRWSARRLRALGRSLIIYAKDHADTFPDTLDDLQSDRATDPAQRSMEQELAEIYGPRYAQQMDARQWRMDARLLPWYREHVRYLGKGVKANDNPAGVLAYDKTLLAEGKGTNVLYVDAHVEFVTPEQFAARVSQATDYARVSVEEGVGLDGIVIGHTQAEFIKSKLGEPDQERNSEETGWWLDYRHRYGLQFRLNRQTGSLVEIQIGNGFKGSLRSGISMSSTMNEVFGVYGKPREVKTVGTSLTKHSASQILYQRMDLLGRLAAAKIHYQQHGLAFWFGPEKIHQIIVHEAGVPEQSIVPPATSASSAEARAESAMRLSDLGKAVLFYAVDHEGKLPEGLIDIRPQFGVGFSWLYDHVEYLGRGMTTHDNPERPIAYDKTLFLEGNGTNVLYLNSRVVFETPERLKVLGIIPDIDARTQAVEKLKALSEQLRSYAADHDGGLPDALSQLKGYTDAAALAWLLANVIYIGQERALSDPDRIIIAYDRTLLQQGQGTVVLYLGGNLVFEDARRLEHLGIRPGRCDYDVERAIATENLPRLAMRAVSYALDFGDGVLPKTLPELKATRMNPDEAFWAWVFDHAVYIAGGADVKDGAHHHTMPIAYSPLTSGQPDRFAVVFADCHVEMVNQARLTELGVKPAPGSSMLLDLEAQHQNRVTAINHLRQLAVAACLYASDNDGVFPDTLEMLEPYLAREEGLWVWVRENVEYTGKGLNPANLAELGKPIAYSRLASDQAVIAFVDGHVEYVIGPPRLKELAIEIER